MYFIIDERNGAVHSYHETLCDASTACPVRCVVVFISSAELAGGETTLTLEGFAPATDERLDEHETELDELFQRVSAIEADFYGEERPLIVVELELDDDPEEPPDGLLN